jgi:hypothetical protein
MNMPWVSEQSLPEGSQGLAAATFDAPSPGAGYRVYAIGGAVSVNNFLAAHVAYDTSANAKQWSSISPMNNPRAFLAATSSPGQLHALGGGDENGDIADAHEIYDPAADAWSSAPPLPTPRFGFAAVTGHDGLIYALGGSSGGEPLATVDAYDPATGEWITSPTNQLAPMHTPRGQFAAVTDLSGNIWAIGGATPGDIMLNSVEILEPPYTGNWVAGPSLPEARAGLAAAVGPDGLIYAIGGVAQTGIPQNTVYSHDEALTGGWAVQANLNVARTNLAAATGPDGLIYAIGGGATGGFTPGVTTVEALAVPLTAPDPYIGNGTIQSPFIVFFDSNGTPVPLEPAGGSWQPSKQYGVQAIIYNDSTVAAPETAVGFWLFTNVEQGQATLVDTLIVTVPANGSVTVGPTIRGRRGVVGKILVSYQGLTGARVAVSVSNPSSPYFNVDPTTPTEVLGPDVERPPGSGHYGSAWRGYPDSCLAIEAQLENLGDLPPEEALKVREGLMDELLKCRAQWGGPLDVD